ncbi:MAG: 16S rRNA (adenine(1518)-N(6)/adenine(1519)-N(6))-dimethyltransferase RsmA [Thermoanaerobaculia bacterium]|nr:16S rRNA (adenine(1518)-N(6)/adenine(1519)-N(6))-dimethyltransferase RsmA [Thermoanaerobaculia bacterium]
MSEHRLRKDLGQHFLTRPEVCAPLLDYLRPAGRTVIEVGPGSGVLTGELAAAGGRVVAWELDPRWAFDLRRTAGSVPLRIVLGDALDIPFDRLPEGSLVAGNLPYGISTRLVLDCLEAAHRRPGRIERAAFLVQLEVAERLLARPSDGAYGSLSVLVRALADAELLGRVRPGAFRPPPKVESAFVGLAPRSDRIEPQRYERFRELVRAAFALRRKTLRNSLAAAWGARRAAALLEATGLDSKVRAEALDVADFAALAERLPGE